MREEREERAARETFLTAVLRTAITDDHGIEHWAIVLWAEPEPGPNGGDGLIVGLEDRHEQLPEGRHDIDATTIAAGFRLLMANTSPHARRASRERYLEARKYNDDSEFDGVDADIVLQLGLFGKIKYPHPMI
jgi:hypothetical protein